jgi:ketol-acid reductoisomerase
MATIYTVQSFQLKGLKLVADQPKTAKTSAAAIEMAERFGDAKAGVVAFSQEVDIETDCYDEPLLLFSSGTVPKDLFDH